ncbi:glycosyl transferase family protein [Tolypothrix sp. NIES-4075]|uniref:glycosyltransferase family 39 protein n=1 Tax=Tolypothrix sp. NIES-4075 TaxID=2005459 RepID=UPI000B5CD665|nr:glycosyltransferase family 39 protein [Tolypothrix sp. NIES-4075]GAX40525.1 glycosyl transferase family protein [Tolypothrix sp. NIES-4075]
MAAKKKGNKYNSLLILGLIWLISALCDRIWFTLDRSVPSWDQADYLTGTLNYWRALQNAQWSDAEWWQGFWLLSSKIPPLTYIITAIFQNIFGKSADQATLVMLLFSGILLLSVYGLGKVLFNESVGLWAAALCQILPGLYRLRLEFLLDYPLASVVTLSFYCLTAWTVRGDRETWRLGDLETWRQGEFLNNTPHPPIPPSPHPPLPSLLWAGAFGLSLGLALLVKQTALFFLLTPIAWVGFAALRQRRWGRLAQLLGSLCLSVLVFAPWYRTNWLIILTSGKRATLDSAIAEHEAPLNTLQAWTYYWHQLPNQVSLPLLLVPIFALLLYWGHVREERQKDKETKRQGDKKTRRNLQNSFLPIPPSSPLPLSPSPPTSYSLKWIAIFWVGSYLLSSLNPNKDDRYVLPYLPVLSLFLAYGLTCSRHLWGKRTRFYTVGLAIILMLFNLFPVGGVLGGWMTQTLSPRSQHYPYLGIELPHRQVIAQIIQTEPYLRSTLGVLPSTAKINQHNLNYYGALENFQVYGRQVGIRKKFLEQDRRSLSWFLTKTGNQGSIPETQAAIVEAVQTSPDFQLNKSWKLPDHSLLKLYHQKLPPIEVKSLSAITPRRIILSRVTVPKKAPPGIPVPVTYEWSGSSQELQQGLVLLTWRNTNNSKWLHDHGIAMGNLHSTSNQHLSVIERMAMLPSADTPPGIYTLEAAYLNRVSGEIYPIKVPKVTLQIDPQATATPAPELDLVTQLRILGANLSKGASALEQIFDEVGRINQYDPTQDYLVQGRLTLGYRLEHIAQNRDWAYALALANVLQTRVNDAIASFTKVIQLDAENPYAYGYLAFVHLYNWQPVAAQKSLQPGLAKNPNITELKGLSAVAYLMQGNIIKAWQIYQEFKGNG